MGDPVGHAVVEDRQAGQFVAVLLEQVAEPDECVAPLPRCPGPPHAECVVCGADRVVDVARPCQRHGSLHFAGRREDVVVDATSTRRAQFAPDVQVHLGNRSIDRHVRSPFDGAGRHSDDQLQNYYT